MNSTTSNVRILLVEDNFINQELALGQLRKLGYNADLAGNGIEAVDAVGCTSYDVILMDCMMPMMDGYEAATRIRQMEQSRNDGGNPVKPAHLVAMTANSMRGDSEKCIAAGMNEYLSKPVQLAALKRVLESWSLANSSSQEMTVASRAVHPVVNTSKEDAICASTWHALEMEAPVDIDRLNEVISHDPAKLIRLIANYLQQGEETIAGLREAIDQGSAVELQFLAHKWAGASATCGMSAVLPALSRLERMGESGVLSEAGETLAEAAHQFSRIRQFLTLHRTADGSIQQPNL